MFTKLVEVPVTTNCLTISTCINILSEKAKKVPVEVYENYFFLKCDFNRLRGTKPTIYYAISQSFSVLFTFCFSIFCKFTCLFYPLMFWYLKDSNYISTTMNTSV